MIAWMNPGEYLSVILSNEDNQSAICIAQIKILVLNIILFERRFWTALLS